MDSQDIRGTANLLANRVGQDASAAQVADAMAATWHDIDVALAPIIGRGGVAALYRRSLHLAAAAHPWLAGLHKGVQATIDTVALKDTFSQQGSADAVLGATAVLDHFQRLLASLIGPSLTDRLMRSFRADVTGSPPAQDTTP